jgi:hypothetical protein
VRKAAAVLALCLFAVPSISLRSFSASRARFRAAVIAFLSISLRSYFATQAAHRLASLSISLRSRPCADA